MRLVVLRICGKMSLFATLVTMGVAITIVHCDVNWWRALVVALASVGIMLIARGGVSIPSSPPRPRRAASSRTGAVAAPVAIHPRPLAEKNSCMLSKVASVQ